jgi:hypothetical protein
MPKNIPPGQEHNYIVRRIRGKAFYVRRSKPSRWSRKQSGQRSKFKEAAAYAKRVRVDDPELYARYVKHAKKRKAWRVFPLITADYLTPPEVHNIALEGRGTPDPMVCVYAVDDFEVKSVGVIVRDFRGEKIGGGPTTKRDGTWQFPLGRPLAFHDEFIVEATACDHPGNKASYVGRCSPSYRTVEAADVADALRGIVGPRRMAARA